jgi:ribonucleotide reductase beta subunit family protein with ferritin-like domain
VSGNGIHINKSCLRWPITIDIQTVNVDYARRRTSRLSIYYSCFRHPVQTVRFDCMRAVALFDSIYYSCFRHPAFRRRTHVLYLLYPQNNAKPLFLIKLSKKKSLLKALYYVYIYESIYYSCFRHPVQTVRFDCMRAVALFDSIYYSCFRHPAFRRRTHVLYLLYPQNNAKPLFLIKLSKKKSLLKALYYVYIYESIYYSCFRHPVQTVRFDYQLVLQRAHRRNGRFERGA